MLLTVSILVALFCFIVKAVNGTTECLFGFCFGISYLFGVYFAYWISSYFSHKKKIQKFKKDLDSILLNEDFLLHFLQRENELQQQQQQQQNTSEQLRADKTKILQWKWQGWSRFSTSTDEF